MGVATIQIKRACFVLNILCLTSDLVSLFSFPDSTCYIVLVSILYHCGVQELKINECF